MLCKALELLRAVHATIATMEEEPMKVTLTEPAVAGEYVIAEQRQDGTLVLRPEASDEVVEQFSDRPLTGDELVESFERHDAALKREGR